MRTPTAYSWCNRLGVVAGLLLFGFAGCGDNPTGPSPLPVVDSPAALVDALVEAYQRLDPVRFGRLIATDPKVAFRFEPLAALPGGATRWDATSELYLHQRMLAPASVPAGDRPVPLDLQLRNVSMSAREVVPFAPVATPPADLDPSHWQLFTGLYNLDALFDTQSATDYRVAGEAELGVVEDLSKQPGEEGRFLLYAWREVTAMHAGAGTGGAAAPATGGSAVEPQSWGDFKQLYAQGGAPGSPSMLVQRLRDAYAGLDLEGYTTLFPSEPGAPEFAFVLSDPLPNGQLSWDAAQELRIHRRMFEPQTTAPGETPVPMQYWLDSITISLVTLSEFTERPDLYRSATNPSGVDPDEWWAGDARYAAFIFWDTQSTTDFRVDGQEIFTVLERRHRLRGVPGREVLYRWEDLGAYGGAKGSSATPGSESASWSVVKSLYG